MASISQGRFLSKKTQSKLGVTAVESFVFGDLDNKMIIPDNPRKSLMLKSMHTEEELRKKVLDAQQFKQQLAAKSKPFLPEDLNAEYARTQEELRVKNRRKLMDEEEAVAQELADMMERNKAGADQMSWKGGQRPSGQKPDQHSNSQGGIASETTAAEMENASSLSVETVHVAAGIAAAAGVREQAGGMMPGVHAPFESNSPANFEPMNEAERERIREEVMHDAWQAGFEEGKTAGFESGVEEGRTSGREEGQKLGFAEGFSSGEVRGEAAGEAKVERMLSLLGEVMRQIDIVRSEILASGQGIFVEFAKLATETILRTQLSFHDETLKAFLVHTMTPFTDKNFLTIEMNPSEAARVSKVLVEYPDLQKKVKVKENSQLAQGDFRVEADNEVVVVDLKKVVSEFVDSLKDDILSPQNEKESA